MTYAKKILLLALLTGALVRLYRLGSVPTGLYWDEAAIGLDAQAVAQTGNDMHGNSWLQAMYSSYGDFKMPGYILAVVPFTKMLGATATAVRLPSALAGIALIGISYLLGNTLFNKMVGAYAALVMAWLPLDILFSRAGFEGHLAVVFVGLSLWLWLESRKRSQLLLLSSVPMALAVYTYFSARVVIPLAFSICILYLFKSGKKPWRLLIVPTVLLWLAMIVPIFLSTNYAASNQFRLSTSNVLTLTPYVENANAMRAIWPNSWWVKLIYHRRVLQVKAFLHNELVHFDPGYLFISGDQNLRHSTQQVGLMLLGELPILILGLVYLWRNQPRMGILLLGLWGMMVIPAAVPLEVPHALRSLNVVLILPLILSYGLVRMKIKKNWWGKLLIGVVIVEAGLFLHDYFVHYPSRSADAWETSYTQLAEKMADMNAVQHECQIAVPDKRLSLYLAYFMQLDPRTFTFDSNGYFAQKMSGLSFSPNLPKELPNNNACLVVNAVQWQQLGKPNGIVFTNAEGEPDLVLIGTL